MLSQRPNVKSRFRLALCALLAFGHAHGYSIASDSNSGEKIPVPNSSRQAVPTSYSIGPGDVLGIEVWKEPDASSAAITVRADGMVTLRLLGEIHVEGLTLSEVQRELEQRYATYFKSPVITVSLKEMNSQVVYLIGEVKKSGSVHFLAPITVLQAIAEAGGLSDFAKRQKIYILRNTDKGQVTYPFDFDAVLKGRKPQENIILRRGDTIVVPR